MRAATLIRRSLRYYWRTHLGVALAAAVATAVLVGALAVGDSVRYSLRRGALARLGETHLAMAPQGRTFRAELARELAAETKAPATPVLALRGTAADADERMRANRVQVLGVESSFWALGRADETGGRLGQDEVILNAALAGRLGAAAGDEILLRIEKPGLLSPDAPLSGEPGGSLAVRLTVRAVAATEQFGDFSLQANQLPPASAFVPLEWLQRTVSLPGRANAILLGDPPGGALSPEAADTAVRACWRLADAGLEIRALPARDALELRSDRVFLDAPAGEAALQAVPGGRRILTYFVNEMRRGDRAAPYSIVTAMDAADGGPVPPDMPDDQIVINSWLADDLDAAPGEAVRVAYFALGEGGRLVERAATFRVRAVTPLQGPADDPDLMPDFPGLADVKNCAEWAPGLPIDLKRIRRKDQDYWDAHRGAPKAFFTLAAGRRMWASRFGDLTAVRWPASTGRDELARALQRRLDPAAVGLFFQDVRRRALDAGEQAQDFGQLFLGLSFFLIAAAVMLTALLFVLAAEQRRGQVGLLLAVGIPPGRVRRLLLAEAAVLAIAGAVAGGAGGLLYTHVMLAALATVWRGAVASARIQYHADPLTAPMGAAALVVIALGAIWLVLRKQARRPARELLAGADSAPPSAGRRGGRITVGAAIAAALGAAAMGVLGLRGNLEPPGAFFGSGGLLLLAVLAAVRGTLSIFASPKQQSGGGTGCLQPVFEGYRREPDNTACKQAVPPDRLSRGSLALRNATRRPGRSLAVVALLACGCFLVIAVGANRQDPLAGADRRSSGTGGFAFYAESALPILQDLNTPEGRAACGLGEAPLPGFSVVPFRVRDGDDASCLNLNRAQTPRLLGVRAELLRDRGAFSFAEAPENEGNPWLLLNAPDSPDVVPAVADQATITWALGLKVGQTLPMTDERGRPFRLRLVAALKNSLLQGSLLINEERFVERFPSEAGRRAMLIDADPAARARAADALRSALPLQDAGLELEPTADRLARFSAVENTYLSIFQALGGLGMLLGSAGLAVVVLRNVLERRGELALMRAVGFTRSSLRRLILREHGALLAAGLACGAGPAVLAVLPALRSAGSEVPYASLAVTLAAIALGGAAWTWLATALALRPPLLDALRNE